MSQILEKLIYRANIFNYDNKFLDDRSNLQLNSEQAKSQVDTIEEFLKDSPENQIKLILSVRKEEKNFDDKENTVNLIQVDPKLQQKAKLFLRSIFELIQLSQKKISDNNSSFNNNLLYGLLYLDGFIMMDIEVVRVFIDYYQQINCDLVRELKSIMYGKFNEDPAKEVSSHILSAFYSFNNPETIELQEWYSLMKWTNDFSLTW